MIVNNLYCFFKLHHSLTVFLKGDLLKTNKQTKPFTNSQADCSRPGSLLQSFNGQGVHFQVLTIISVTSKHLLKWNTLRQKIVKFEWAIKYDKSLYFVLSTQAPFKTLLGDLLAVIMFLLYPNMSAITVDADAWIVNFKRLQVPFIRIPLSTHRLFQFQSFDYLQ